MAAINAVQDQEVTFLSGVTASGTAAPISYGTWNYDSPATYGSGPGENYTAKFGPSTAGTGATITYTFDLASNWTASEKAAFAAAAHLWSAVANITFIESTPGTAQVLLARSTDESATGGQDSFTAAVTGTSQLGVARSGVIAIDTTVAGFGPIGSTLSNYGGFPYTVLIHEWGHVLGLGHAGPYNEGDVSAVPYTSVDNRSWSLMSYNDAPYNWGVAPGDNGLFYDRSPTSWMPLDILAIQRLYGVAVNTPLSGGQTYGFHSNIAGDIAKFFDFAINTRPVVTLWNKGINNSLDLSSTSLPSTIDLHDGAFSSVLGLEGNVAIAFGTKIDTAITGSGADKITGNDDSDVIIGGANADSIMGGSGNDHLYGGGMVVIANDGADTIDGGGGGDYIQGNAGDDLLRGGDGSDRIQGGQGSDSIEGGTGNDSINGNLGNDVIDGGEGNDSLRGGQGADSISGSAGDDILLGDLGADTLVGGAGADVLTGGADSDVFSFAMGDAIVLNGMTDVITDFSDGVDRIHLPMTISTILHGSAYVDFLGASIAAAQTLRSIGDFGNVDVLAVGSDTYIFYTSSGSAAVEAIKLAAFPAALITAADFV